VIAVAQRSLRTIARRRVAPGRSKKGPPFFSTNTAQYGWRVPAVDPKHFLRRTPLLLRYATTRLHRRIGCNSGNRQPTAKLPAPWRLSE
jgi:hypothetical protein